MRNLRKRGNFEDLAADETTVSTYNVALKRIRQTIFAVEKQ